MDLQKRNLSQIKKEDIAITNPQTSADLLNMTGHVYIQKSQLGGGSPMIRGFSTNRLILSIDGVRLNNVTNETVFEYVRISGAGDIGKNGLRLISSSPILNHIDISNNLVFKRFFIRIICVKLKINLYEFIFSFFIFTQYII